MQVDTDHEGGPDAVDAAPVSRLVVELTDSHWVVDGEYLYPLSTWVRRVLVELAPIVPSDVQK